MLMIDDQDKTPRRQPHIIEPAAQQSQLKPKRRHEINVVNKEVDDEELMHQQTKKLSQMIGMCTPPDHVHVPDNETPPIKEIEEEVEKLLDVDSKNLNASDKKPSERMVVQINASSEREAIDENYMSMTPQSYLPQKQMIKDLSNEKIFVVNDKVEKANRVTKQLLRKSPMLKESRTVESHESRTAKHSTKSPVRVPPKGSIGSQGSVTKMGDENSIDASESNTKVQIIQCFNSR